MTGAAVVTINASLGATPQGTTISGTVNQGAANATPWNQNISQVAGQILGAIANYGTTPGPVLVPGVNAFITNVPAVSQSGTWTVQPGNTANTTPWLFTIQQGGNPATVSAGGALKVDGSAVTQPVSGTVATSNLPNTVDTGTGASGASTIRVAPGTGNFTVVQPTGTNLHVVADTGSTMTVTGNVSTVGTASNNAGAPAATSNLGVLPAIANAASPSWTEGNQVLASTDLTGRQRVRGTATNNNAAPGADQIDIMPNVANAASPTWVEGNSTKDSVDLAGRKRTFNPDLTPGTCTITASGTANGCTVTMSGYAGAGFIVTAGGAGTATLAPYIVGPDCSTIRTTATQMMDVANGSVVSSVANPATGKVYQLLGPQAGDCKVGVYASAFTANITIQLRATTIPFAGQGFNVNGGTWTPWPLYTNAPSTTNGQPFWQSYVDPCAAPGVLKSHKFANITTSTTTQIIAVSGSTNIYICGIDVQLNSTTSSTILFEHGTGAACTGTVSDTATYSNGGLTSETIHMGFGAGTYYATGASQGVCAVTTVGTSPTISVDITMVQQ